MISGNTGWTKGLQSKSLLFGVALLWYKPERRLSVSFSVLGYWHNIRLWGPRKLSFERK